MTTYTITALDSDKPPAWLGLCETVVPGAQDSGCVLYRVTTSRALDLEFALDADDDVIRYLEVT